MQSSRLRHVGRHEPNPSLLQAEQERRVARELVATSSIIAAAAWNKLTDQPWLIMSIGLRAGLTGSDQ
jgi:hypothetical protein